MKKLLFILLVSPFLLFSQEEQNDPQAKVILDKVSAKVEKAKTISAEFKLIIKLADTAEEIQKGKLVQKGKQYRVEVESQEIISNGESVYFIFKDQNTAQLHSASEMEGQDNMMNPLSMLKIYESGDYIYQIVGQERIKDRLMTAIEFKPVDRYSEYSKIRLSIDEQNARPNYIKVFVKDGSVFTLEIDTIEIDKPVDASQFTFEKSNYPKLSIEDLRID